MVEDIRVSHVLTSRSNVSAKNTKNAEEIRGWRGLRPANRSQSMIVWWRWWTSSKAPGRISSIFPLGWLWDAMGLSQMLVTLGFGDSNRYELNLNHQVAKWIQDKSPKLQNGSPIWWFENPWILKQTPFDPRKSRKKHQQAPLILMDAETAETAEEGE